MKNETLFFPFLTYMKQNLKCTFLFFFLFQFHRVPNGCNGDDWFAIGLVAASTWCWLDGALLLSWSDEMSFSKSCVVLVGEPTSFPLSSAVTVKAPW